MKDEVYLDKGFDFQIVFDNFMATYSDMNVRGGRHICCDTESLNVQTSFFITRSLVSRNDTWNQLSFY